MRFQIPSLVSHKSIAGTVRFIEGILCKRFPVSPYLLQFINRMTFGGCSIHKLLLHFIQYRKLLLTHGFTEYIRISFREACQFLGKQHHLFLIYCNTIGFLQVFCHIIHVISYLLLTMFTQDKLRDVGNWPRTIQGIHRNQIRKLIGLQLT